MLNLTFIKAREIVKFILGCLTLMSLRKSEEDEAQKDIYRERERSNTVNILLVMFCFLQSKKGR